MTFRGISKQYQPHHFEYWYQGESSGANSDWSPAINRAFAAGQLHLEPYEKGGLYSFYGPITSVPTRAGIYAEGATIEHRAAEGLFTGSSLREFTFKAKYLLCSSVSGHVLNDIDTIVASEFDIGFLNLIHPTTASFYYAPNGESYEGIYRIRYCRRTPSSTPVSSAPVFDAVGAGNYFRGNTIDFGFVYSALDNPIVKIAGNHPGNALNMRNKYRFRTCEVPAGGVAHLGAEAYSEIYAGLYDMSALASDTTEDMIRLGRGDLVTANDGGFSRNVLIDYMNTYHAKIVSPGYDINLTDATECTVRAMGNNSANLLRVDFAGGKHTATSDEYATFDNAANVNILTP